jgi:flagellar biosynthesis protein FlhA
MTQSVLPVSLGSRSALTRAGTLLIFGLLGMIAVLVVPLPTFVLDLLITLNVACSLLILMATLAASRPLDFSTFPSVILLTALLRLSLNVASTRLILLQGDAGAVIRAFGEFVVGGNTIVGIVVFLILIIVQFVVITKGQNRIAEVTARFTLDAMPGKQMGIDADLNAGAISNEEARERRAELARENEFYGAMDGAGKFIRGDAIAGLIITAINIIGGIAIGTLVRGLDVGQALQAFAVLTVGDGLVSQVPSLIVSIASGILITKAASHRDLAQEMVGQMTGRRVVLRIVGGTLAALALVPGLPTVPFFLVGVAMLAVASRRPEQPDERDQAGAQPTTELSEEQRLQELLRVDRLGLEIGYRLISLVESSRHGSLLEHIASLRRQMAGSLGIVIPPVRVKDNVQLEPNAYRVLLMGQEIAKGEVRAGQYLAMDPTGQATPIDGTPTVEPAFGLPARWITEGQKEQAEIMGYTVIDAPSVLITHLTEVLKRTAHELLSREDVQALLDNTKKLAPTVVSDVVPGLLSASEVQRVLALLLKEQVPIRNLALILEALGDAAATSKDCGHLVESVRLRLARAICEPYLDGQSTLHVATIHGPLEARLARALTGGGNGSELLAQGELGRFVECTAGVLAGLAKDGKPPVLVTRAQLRPLLAEAVTSAVPGSAVLSYQEVACVRDVKVKGQVTVEGVAA